MRAFFQALVDRLWAEGTGSANRVARALLLEEPPHIDRGEVTDKGSINQRAVLQHRADAGRAPVCRGARRRGHPAAALMAVATTPDTRRAAALDPSAMQHLMGYRLTLAEVASRRVFQRHIGTPFKLRPVEFTILLLLLGNGNAAPKQLAQTLGLPPPNVTVLVDRLVERGLVQRTRSPTDRPRDQPAPHRQGRRPGPRVQRVSQTMEAGLLAPLSAGERAMLAELLQKLAHHGADAPPS